MPADEAAPPARSRRRALLLLAPALLPPAAIAALVARYGVDTPYLDDWATVRLFVRLRNGTLTLAQLFEQHNESRKFFPRLLEIALGEASGWDFRAKMFAIVALAGVTLAAVASLLLREFPVERAAFPLFLSSLLLFGPVQHQNWLWGIQLSLVLPIAILAGGLALLARPAPDGGGGRWVVAALLATVAAFSYVNGLLVALLLLPSLLLVAPGPAPARRLSGWLLLTGALFALYFAGYHRPGQAPSTTLLLRQPLDALLYVCTFLGSPFQLGTGERELPAATAAGGALLVAFVALVALRLRSAADRGERAIVVAHATIGGYALASAAMNAVGRLGLGRANALSSRYTTVAVLLAVAVVGLALGGRPGRLRRGLSAAALALLVVLHLAASARAMGAVRDAREGLLQARATLFFLATADDPVFAQRLWPDVPALRPVAREANRLGFFRPPLHDSPRLPAGAFDPAATGFGWVDDATVVGGAIELGGWAVLPGEGRPADLVVLTAEEPGGTRRVVALAPDRVERPDVAARLGARTGRWSGWRATVSPVPAGRIEAWAVDAADGRLHRLGGDAAAR